MQIKFETMKNTNCLVELTHDELVNLNGGTTEPLTKSSTWGQDVGYIVGWLLSAMGKGASAIQG